MPLPFVIVCEDNMNFFYIGYDTEKLSQIAYWLTKYEKVLYYVAAQ